MNGRRIALSGLLFLGLFLGPVTVANAQECLIGEVRMFAGNFAPRSWALCDGQTLAINSNQALFSILGTTYGGNGETTFALPDLRGRVAMHTGQGPGLTGRTAGQKVGSETVTLTEAQLPSHRHDLVASAELASATQPEEQLLAAKSRTNVYAPLSNEPGSTTALAEESIAPTGGGQSVPNVQPSLVINHIICVNGIFPSEN